MLGIPDRSRGCLFDLDGVLTQTAAVRAAAWPQIFDDFLRQRADRTGGRFVPFDAASVLKAAGLSGQFDTVVDGAVREAGADVVVRDLAELLDER